MDNGRKFELHKPLAIYLSDDKGSIYVTVPEGDVTDFATTHRLIWSIFPPTGKYGKAATVHGYLITGGTATIYGETRTVDLETAAYIFLLVMELQNVPKWKRVVMYNAVLAYGYVRPFFK